MREARTKRRVSIERASNETRIRSDYLMRMESDDFDFLAPTYVRGFLRSYARYLALDPAPLLEDLDRALGTQRGEEASILAADASRSPQSPRSGRGMRRRAIAVGPSAPRRAMSSWSVAALVALGVLALLSVIGYLQPQSSTEGTQGTQIARNSPSPRSTSSTPHTSPSPSQSSTQPSTPQAIAFDNGIHVEIVAVRGPCWFSVQGDGVQLGQETIYPGQKGGPFDAQQAMQIRLGSVGAVDLIVNGHRIRPRGAVGEIATITLPDDAKSLL